MAKHEATDTTTTSGKVSRKEFEKELGKLQVELTRLQTWVQAERARVIVVFEGRDTAGKGGVISRITARTSSRVYKHVALPAPSDREKTQVYVQRYIAQFPAAGEIILFDRSWYNRAGEFHRIFPDLRLLRTRRNSTARANARTRTLASTAGSRPISFNMKIRSSFL